MPSKKPPIIHSLTENTKICSPAMSRLLTINQYATRFSPSFVNGTSSNSQRKFPGEEQYSNVILDVAACDGPVFFERVVNKAFKVSVIHWQIIHFISGEYPCAEGGGGRTGHRPNQKMDILKHL